MTIGQNAPENMGVDTETVPVDLPRADQERPKVRRPDFPVDEVWDFVIFLSVFSVLFSQ